MGFSKTKTRKKGVMAGAGPYGVLNGHEGNLFLAFRLLVFFFFFVKAGFLFLGEMDTYILTYISRIMHGKEWGRRTARS